MPANPDLTTGHEDLVPVGYINEWALFCDYCAATGQPALPTNTTTLCGFLAALPSSGQTRARRIRAIITAHRNAGYLTGRPLGPHQPTGIAAHTDVARLLAACPLSGWPEGFTGRRDAFLIVATKILGFPHHKTRHLTTNDITETNETIRIRGVTVPTTVDTLTCPCCVVVRWLEILGIADGLGRGTARMHLTHSSQENRENYGHTHTLPTPERWRGAAQLLPAIDQHGWINDHNPLTTRTITQRLAHRTHTANKNTTDQTTNKETKNPNNENPTTPPNPQPREKSELSLNDVLKHLDTVAEDADALNDRITTLLQHNW